MGGWGVRSGALGVATCLALLGVGAPAAAAAKPISGKLKQPGYSVLALADDGEVTTVAPGTQRFRLAPPAKRVSLHLRAVDGTYAGPVVVGEEGKGGKRAIVGVEAGARLGKVKVKAANGYAKPTEELAERWLDAKRTARAKGGVPIGAGSFGHVSSASGGKAVPGDADRDGIPDALDVDDDGDLVLDALDDSPAPGSKARSTGPPPGPCAPNPFCVNSNLFVPAAATANSHVGSDDEAIDQTLMSFGNISLSILPGGPVELDCGGSNQQPPRPEALIYCRPHTSGGTGLASQGVAPGGIAFPDCCDDEDGDGFGTMFRSDPGPVQGQLRINHFARSAEIGTGDVLIEHIATGGDVGQCPPPDRMPSPSCTSFTSGLSFVFHASPALATYTPEAGEKQSVNYPISGPLTVGDGPDDGDDVEVTLEFFRAQRRPTPGEPGHGQPGAWMDVGGLEYGVSVDFVAGSPGTGGSCPQDAFSTNDDELGPRPPAPITPAGLADSAPDRPASTPDTLTFTLNITQCIGGATWAPGQNLGLSFRASKQGSLTDQSGVIFRRGP